MDAQVVRVQGSRYDVEVVYVDRVNNADLIACLGFLPAALAELVGGYYGSQLETFSVVVDRVDYRVGSSGILQKVRLCMLEPDTEQRMYAWRKRGVYKKDFSSGVSRAQMVAFEHVLDILVNYKL
jgi:hypothetical protein